MFNVFRSQGRNDVYECGKANSLKSEYGFFSVREVPGLTYTLSKSPANDITELFQNWKNDIRRIYYRQRGGKYVRTLCEKEHYFFLYL